MSVGCAARTNVRVSESPVRMAHPTCTRQPMEPHP